MRRDLLAPPAGPHTATGPWTGEKHNKKAAVLRPTRAAVREGGLATSGDVSHPRHPSPPHLSSPSLLSPAPPTSTHPLRPLAVVRLPPQRPSTTSPYRLQRRAVLLHVFRPPPRHRCLCRCRRHRPCLRVCLCRHRCCCRGGRRHCCCHPSPLPPLPPLPSQPQTLHVAAAASAPRSRLKSPPAAAATCWRRLRRRVTALGPSFVLPLSSLGDGGHPPRRQLLPPPLLWLLLPPPPPQSSRMVAVAYCPSGQTRATPATPSPTTPGGARKGKRPRWQSPPLLLPVQGRTGGTGGGAPPDTTPAAPSPPAAPPPPLPPAPAATPHDAAVTAGISTASPVAG